MREGVQRNRSMVRMSSAEVVSWRDTRRVSSVPMARTGVTTIPAWGVR